MVNNFISEAGDDEELLFTVVSSVNNDPCTNIVFLRPTTKACQLLLQLSFTRPMDSGYIYIIPLPHHYIYMFVFLNLVIVINI